jgi:glycosyltransferase involved in cell wall biosynthesis
VTDVRDRDDRIEVWYLIGTLAVGGTEKTLVDLVSGLDRERFAPTIWTLADPGPLAEEVPDDVPVRSLGASSKADLRAPLRFILALRRERPDVLQSFLYFDNTVARLAGMFSPETTVITGVREVPESLPIQRDIIDRAIIGLSDHIVSNSKAGAEWIIDRGATPDDVTVVPNGRDVERYAGPTESEDLKKEFDLQDGPVIGTVGRLVEIKGGFDLVDAWPAILDSFPSARLVIIGDGPEREALESRAVQHGCEDSVVFTGKRDDVPALLSVMDLFVFPSHHEGHPGALLEAMCAGLPIVTTPVGGCSELVRDGKEGVHVPVREPNALSRAITGLLRDEQRANSLATAAQRRAHEEFRLQRMVESYERQYERYS